MNRYYSIRQAGREADVYIFGDLTPVRWSEDETSAYSFKKELDALDADVIHVHINSYGGSVSEGWAIYNTLREHPARIVTHADGFVASAAIYPFMAGDERLASNLSAFFFHQVLMYVEGNADELRAAADEAEKINEIGLAAFSNAGIDPETVRALEKDETWIDADEALRCGFATAIVADETPRMAQSVKAAVLQTVLGAAKRKVPRQDAADGTPRVIVVWGPPCSGKSTYIRERLEPGDLAYDYDRLVDAVTLRASHEVDTGPAHPVVRDFRNSLIYTVRNGLDAGTVYIAASWPGDYLKSRLEGLDPEYVQIESTIEECMARLEADDSRVNKEAWAQLIRDWFEKHAPEPAPGPEPEQKKSQTNSILQLFNKF